MGKIVPFSLRVTSGTVLKVKEFCAEKGLKIGIFIEQAIKEKIERDEFLEDVADMIKLRYQEPASIPAGDYFEKRGI